MTLFLRKTEWHSTYRRKILETNFGQKYLREDSHSEALKLLVKQNNVELGGLKYIDEKL